MRCDVCLPLPYPCINVAPFKRCTMNCHDCALQRNDCWQQFVSPFRSQQSAISATGIECVCGELLHHQNAKLKEVKRCRALNSHCNDSGCARTCELAEVTMRIQCASEVVIKTRHIANEYYANKYGSLAKWKRTLDEPTLDVARSHKFAQFQWDPKPRHHKRK